MQVRYAAVPPYITFDRMCHYTNHRDMDASHYVYTGDSSY